MLPKQLKYGSKVESAMAQSYRTNNIQPQNGTSPYTLGQTIISNAPTANNIVLAPTESYLKFYVSYTNGGTANNNVVYDSCGAHGLIQRIRIFHGSNLLQDIDNYGLLAKMLFDLQVPTDASYGRYNALVGTRDGLNTTITAAQFTAAALLNTSTKQINSGEYGILAGANVVTGDLPYGTTGQRYYCLNLISLLGTLLPAQYIPLFAMTSAPLRLEIQLVSNSFNALGSLTALTASLNNVEYIANFIKLSDNAMSMIYGSLGSQIMPTKAPDNLPEMFSELLKAMGSMSDLNYHPSIEYDSYKTPSSTVLTAVNYTSTNSGSFYIGIDLENYVSASKDTIFAGYNSNTDDIFAVINLSPTTGALTPRFDAFANFDS
eukprot:gene17347-23956_t